MVCIFCLNINMSIHFHPCLVPTEVRKVLDPFNQSNIWLLEENTPVLCRATSVTGFLSVALTVLELTIWTRLALDSEICLSLSDGIKGIHHHHPALAFVYFFSSFKYFYRKSLITFVCVYICVNVYTWCAHVQEHVCHSMCMEVRRKLAKFDFSYYVHPENQAQVTRLGLSFCLMSHLSDP